MKRSSPYHLISTDHATDIILRATNTAGRGTAVSDGYEQVLCVVPEAHASTDRTALFGD